MIMYNLYIHATCLGSIPEKDKCVRHPSKLYKYIYFH